MTQEWKPNLSLESINGHYFSRLIDSLENDYDQWERKHCGGGPGWTWIEYNSPEYKNKEGERLQFTFGLNYDGAYINGRIGWTIGFWQRWNLFSYRTRRFWKAKRTMIKHLKQIELREYKEKLMKSL
jgi:hypothetical protein